VTISKQGAVPQLLQANWRIHVGVGEATTDGFSLERSTNYFSCIWTRMTMKMAVTVK
jgi:hypothetical protein